MTPGGDGTPVIEARGLTKEHSRPGGAVAALSGVDLRVERGASLAVMGPSGAGKSTLLAILGCLERPTSGSYLLEGRAVDGLNDRELSLIRAKSIGFVFQTFNLISHLTVLENVALPFLFREGAGGAAGAREAAKRALERVGLAHRLGHRPAELSGGEMQRTALARAVAGEPSLLLADEPTGNLDSATGAMVLDMLCSLNSEGMTMVVVTHDPGVAGRLGQVVRLADGRVDGRVHGRTGGRE